MLVLCSVSRDSREAHRDGALDFIQKQGEEEGESRDVDGGRGIFLLHSHTYDS